MYYFSYIKDLSVEKNVTAHDAVCMTEYVTISQLLDVKLSNSGSICEQYWKHELIQLLLW